MTNSIESLLENDHESLDQLLIELNNELTSLNIARSYELLHRFWARLAVHIRAENLHLFPAIANCPRFTGKGNLPTSEEVHNLLLRLRSDHDFFMKELAQLIKAAREIRAGQRADLKDAGKLRRRLAIIRKRLETHNSLEEEQAYIWPSLLFDEQTVAELCDHVKHELENLPPRFAA